MKSILASKPPKIVVGVMNGGISILIFKKFPKDYRGWVYFYCTKGKDRLVHDIGGHIVIDNEHYAYGDEELNGKVVARFYCDNVEELFTDEDGFSYYTDTIQEDYKVSKLACLDDADIDNYLIGGSGYAVHISNLEIFDKPKELNEFYSSFRCKRHNRMFANNSVEYDEKMNGLRQPTRNGYEWAYPLTKAPRNFCYVEVDTLWEE